MKNTLPTPGSNAGKTTGRNGVGISKIEIHLNPYAGGHIADLSFLYSGLAQYAAAPSRAARERLGQNLAKNTSDWNEVLDYCKKVYQVKGRTSLARFADEAALLEEVESVKRFFVAASSL
jgi:hypothetical protein